MKKIFTLLVLTLATPFVAWSLIAAYGSFTEAVNNQWFEENGLIWIGEATEVIEDTNNNITATKFTVLEVWCGEIQTITENAPDYMDIYVNTQSEIWLISDNYSSDYNYPVNTPIIIGSLWQDYRYSTNNYGEDWLPIDQSNDSVTGFIHFDQPVETMTLAALEAELSLEHCDAGTGIATDLLISTNLYPNPAENIVQVVFDSNDETDLSIYNATGSLVLEMKGALQSAQLDLSKLPAGMYFVAFSQDGILVGNERFMKK